MVDIALAADVDYTTNVDQVVIETPAINAGDDDLIQQVTADGTNVVYAARYNHGQLVTAINRWSLMMAIGGESALTYADTSGTAIVTLTSATTTPLTTNAGTSDYLLFDTDPEAGGPVRVGATFTWADNTAATTSITASTFGWTTASTWSRMEPKQIGNLTVWVPRELTDEEKAAEAAMAAECERRRLVAEEERKVADDKAETLLRKILTRKQREELDAYGYFHVWAKDGFKYRITRSSGHNVTRVCPETDRVLKRFCIVPKIFIPGSDRLLAQKLLLEADPERFVRLSNVWDS